MYQRFMCDVVAVAHEMNRMSGDTKNGMVPIDARLFNELMRMAAKARSGFNAHLEFTTAQGIQRLNTRFSLDNPQKVANATQEVVDEEIQPEGQTDAA